ncbi:MAG: DUF1273 domain-containing protein [Clostridia bacterium]|nr:DUF1273 domain-containing protein [Clostridia bacterium]
MKNLTCCFTGHRNIPANERTAIQKRLEFALTHLIHQGVCYFCAGGALGFDTMAALAVLKLKSAFPHIRLILVLPCKEQTRGWAKEDAQNYNQILSQAAEVIYTSAGYHRGCMQKRNRQLVDYSRFCICYLTDWKSGAAYTVGYAKQKGLHVIHLVNSCPRQEIFPV